MPRPRLSIVIPVYDNWWLTARCLRSIEALRDDAGLPFETIVVDNASCDETPRAIAGFSWVRYVRHERNVNFAGGCNAGARIAEAPLVLFLNNDAYPLGDAFGPLVRAFDRSDVAIAGGALFFEDGVTQAAGLVLLRDGHWHYAFRNLPASLSGVNASRDALAVSGAALAVRTDWFLESGGFDESFVNGFEDVDLCLRARERGRTIAYVAGARFAHYEAASAGRFAREAENERRFYRRWSARFAALPRTVRGEVGAIVVRACTGNPLLAAALADLEEALRGFGHPVMSGAIPPWRRFDRRFRHSAVLDWFADEAFARGAAIGGLGAAASIRTRGAANIEVPWLPCADPERIGALGVRRSDDANCTLVGVVGEGSGALARTGYSVVEITPDLLLGGGRAVALACVVHFGLTDPSAFGNVVLSQAGLPAVVARRDELRGLFASDVALSAEGDGIETAIVAMVTDRTARVRYGTRLAADARRRFSPRRSAIRVVDLLCAARFGLERPQDPYAGGPYPPPPGV